MKTKFFQQTATIAVSNLERSNSKDVFKVFAPQTPADQEKSQDERVPEQTKITANY